MKATNKIKSYRCAIYTRKSHEEGLEQEFNSLDAQRESGEAYIKSQQHEQWKLLSTKYDDGGFSGGNLERPALKQLLADIERGKIDVIVVYKVDRLSRSLSDFAKLMELFDQHQVSFVSVTQQFNTTSSMGRLTLNMLLSFAQFEREVTSERIRDKFAASKQKGMWMGGTLPFGYRVEERKLIIIDKEATVIKRVYDDYLNRKTPLLIAEQLNKEGLTIKQWQTQKGKVRGGGQWSPKQVYRLLTNPLYIGKIKHKDKIYEGEHQAIINLDFWEKVQQKIQKNSSQEKQQTEKKISNSHPLKGLLRLATGESLSPSGTKGIRYYVSQRAIKQGYKNCDLKSLNANLLEDIVFAYALNRLPIILIQYILNQYQTTKHEGWLIIRKLIQSITVSTTAIWITLDKKSINEVQQQLEEDKFYSTKQSKQQLSSPFAIVYPAEYQEDENTITSKIIVQIKRHDGRRYILSKEGKQLIYLVQDKTNIKNTQRANDYQSITILQSIAEVHVWKDYLQTKEMTVKKLAKEINKSDGYIHKRLKLLALSPIILKQITTQTLSPLISIKDLIKASSFLDWNKQHKFLSISD